MAQIAETHNGGEAASIIEELLDVAVTANDSGSEVAAAVNAAGDGTINVVAADSGSSFADKIDAIAESTEEDDGTPKLKILSLNVGHWANGNAAITNIDAANYENKRQDWEAVLDGFDVICAPEYSNTFAKFGALAKVVEGGRKNGIHIEKNSGIVVGDSVLRGYNAGESTVYTPLKVSSIDTSNAYYDVLTTATEPSGDWQNDDVVYGCADAADAIFSDYPYYTRTNIGDGSYYINAIFSKFSIINTWNFNIDKEEGTSGSVRYATINWQNKTIYICCVHLDWGRNETFYNSRQRELAWLLEVLLADDTKPYVVICGDFNTDGTRYALENQEVYNQAYFDAFLAGINEFDGFLDAGYSLASSKSHPVLTCPSTGHWPSPRNVPFLYLDNIIAKGLKVKFKRLIDRSDLTDHCGIVAELTLIDNEG